ncbi:hypothetical protein BURPS668_A2917 [Burkholderia pseudomallei 668]|nr:hypothetical protein BURPS668_A2917 [Burkholderia pseudomallei 668]
MPALSGGAPAVASRVAFAVRRGSTRRPASVSVEECIAEHAIEHLLSTPALAVSCRA